jgi:hypothetical protein
VPRQPGPAAPKRPEESVLAWFLQTPTAASGEAIVPTPAAASCLCHGLTCLAVAGGRLLHPGNAQAEPLKASRIRALLLLDASAYPSGPDRSSGLGHPRDRFAKSNRRHCEPPATPLPRTRSSALRYCGRPLGHECDRRDRDPQMRELHETRLRRGDGSMLVLRRERAAVRAATPGSARRCFPSAGPRQERFELRAVVARLVLSDIDVGAVGGFRSHVVTALSALPPAPLLRLRRSTRGRLRFRCVGRMRDPRPTALAPVEATSDPQEGGVRRSASPVTLSCRLLRFAPLGARLGCPAAVW